MMNKEERIANTRKILEENNIDTSRLNDRQIEQAGTELSSAYYDNMNATYKERTSWVNIVTKLKRKFGIE